MCQLELYLGASLLFDDLEDADGFFHDFGADVVAAEDEDTVGRWGGGVAICGAVCDGVHWGCHGCGCGCRCEGVVVRR